MIILLFKNVIRENLILCREDQLKKSLNKGRLLIYLTLFDKGKIQKLEMLKKIIIIFLKSFKNMKILALRIKVSMIRYILEATQQILYFIFIIF